MCAADLLRADEEAEVFVAPADTKVEKRRLVSGQVLARHRNDVVWINAEEVQFIDIAPSQMVGVSAGLIPFLEHDDANRALMGSNIHRQAVPLLITEIPAVGTGMEEVVAKFSGMVVRAPKSGKITSADSPEIPEEGQKLVLSKSVGERKRAE